MTYSGSTTPSAAFGGSTNNRMGTLSDPSAPPNPDLEIATADTAASAMAQKRTGALTIISKPIGWFISDPYPAG
ncbi:MAG: hypothetical protein ACPHO7_06895 [Candidatus Puniceispirillaceae bacterium]